MSWPKWRLLAAVLLTCTMLAPLVRAEEAFVIHLSDDSSDEVSEELASFEPNEDAILYEPVTYRTWLDDAPGMLGDGFFGRSGPLQGPVPIDRLFVVANDLDSPNPLPAGNQVITITEPGPIGIFSSSVASIQDIQQLLQASQPLPAATLQSQIAASATLTTTMTVAQLQALLASTPEAFDIITLNTPPASYSAGVDAAFQTRNGAVGTTMYNAAASGALLQSGADGLTGTEDFDAFYYYDYNVNINVQSPYVAAVRSGLLKASTGNSAMPRARAYFRYDLFSNVGLRPGGESVNRFVPGFERVFHDGLWSLEMRFPFASSLASNLTASQSGLFGGSDVQFGDISMFFKVLLHQTDTTALSAGLALSLPTANDLNVNLASGTPFMALQNEAVHIGPFLAGLYAPNDRFFAQGFLQFDFDTNGNEVLFNTTGTGLASAGRLTDAPYVFADAGIGYWLASPGESSHATALMAEVHYNGALNNGDSVQSGKFRIGDGATAVDTLNLTVGASVQLGHNTNLSAGYVTPLTGNADRQFDGALNVNLEYRPR